MEKVAKALTAQLLDPSLYEGDPHPYLARLRAEAPVAWNGEAGFWALSRHRDVLEVSRDHQRFCSGKGILVFEIGVEYPTPPTMMHTDPPEHTRYRKLVQPGFRPSFIRSLEPSVRARARALIEKIEPGSPVDFVTAVSVPLPLQVISDLLGIPEEDWGRFFEWSEAAIPGATDWPEDKRQALHEEMVAYLLEATRRRRGDPRDDIVSELANATVDGDSLTDAELAMFLVQLLVAGNETTRNMLSGGLVALAADGNQWSRLVGDPSLVPTAVEEMLRWTTPVIYFMRTATRDTEVGGEHISAGDPLVLLYASANRDERAFGPTAGAFDVGRDPNPHLSFGFGAHFCIGAALARLEGRVLLEELLARFSALEPAGQVERTASPVIAGLRHAPLAFKAPGRPAP